MPNSDSDGNRVKESESGINSGESSGALPLDGKKAAECADSEPGLADDHCGDDDQAKKGTCDDPQVA